MGSATFFDAFDALSLAFVLPVLVRLWGISAVEIGWLIAAGYLGQFVGALVFGGLAERYGRVPSAAGATALMSVMSLACALAGNLPTLLVLRLVQGIGVGGEMPVAAVYINELSKAKGRGRFFLLYEMIFPVGLMVTGQVGALVVPTLGWQVMFLIGAVPGLVIAGLLLRLRESPRWLIGQGPAGGGGGDHPGDRGLGATEPRGHDGHEGHEADRHEERRALRDLRGSVEPHALDRAALADLSRPHRHRVGALGERLLHHQRPEQLDADAVQPRLRPEPGPVAARRHADQRRPGRHPAGLRVRHRPIGRRRWMTVCFIAGAVLLAALGSFASGSVTAVIVLVTLSYGIVGSVNAVLYLYTPEIYPDPDARDRHGSATCWLRLASAAGPLLVGIPRRRTAARARSS